VWNLRGDLPTFLALEGKPGVFDKYFDDDALAIRYLPAAFSRDGMHVVTAFDNHTVRVWDLRGERPSFLSLEWHQEDVRSAGFNLDGTRVVTLYEASARVWDLGGELLRVVSPKGHQIRVRALAFNPDGGPSACTSSTRPMTAPSSRLQRRTAAALVDRLCRMLGRSCRLRFHGTRVPQPLR
jgi:WD40 repeat protein